MLFSSRSRENTSHMRVYDLFQEIRVGKSRENFLLLKIPSA
jgi:hypothetical protein